MLGSATTYIPSSPRRDSLLSPSVGTASNASVATQDPVTEINTKRDEIFARLWQHCENQASPSADSSSSTAINPNRFDFNFGEAIRVTQGRLSVVQRESGPRIDDPNLQNRLERRLENLRFLQAQLAASDNSQSPLILVGVWGWGDPCGSSIGGTLKAGANDNISQFDTFFVWDTSTQELKALQVDSSFQLQLEGVMPPPSRVVSQAPSAIASSTTATVATLSSELATRSASASSSLYPKWIELSRQTRVFSGEVSSGLRTSAPSTRPHTLNKSSFLYSGSTATVEDMRTTLCHSVQFPAPASMQYSPTPGFTATQFEPHLAVPGSASASMQASLGATSITASASAAAPLADASGPSGGFHDIGSLAQRYENNPQIGKEARNIAGEFSGLQAQYVGERYGVVGGVVLPYDTYNVADKQSCVQRELERIRDKKLMGDKSRRLMSLEYKFCPFLSEPVEPFSDKMPKKLMKVLINAASGYPIKVAYPSGTQPIPQRLAQRILQELSNLQWDHDLVNQMKSLVQQRQSNPNSEHWLAEQKGILDQVIAKWKSGRTGGRTVAVPFESLMTTNLSIPEIQKVTFQEDEVIYHDEQGEKKIHFPLFFDNFLTGYALFQIFDHCIQEEMGPVAVNPQGDERVPQLWEKLLMEGEYITDFLNHYEICCPECSFSELNGVVQFARDSLYPELMTDLWTLIDHRTTGSSRTASQYIETFRESLNRETNPKQALMLANQFKTVYEVIKQRLQGEFSMADQKRQKIEFIMKWLLRTARQLTLSVWKLIEENAKIPLPKDKSFKAHVGLARQELEQGLQITDKWLTGWFCYGTEDRELTDQIRDTIASVRRAPVISTQSSISGTSQHSGVISLGGGASGGELVHRESDHQVQAPPLSKPVDVLVERKSFSDTLLELSRPKKVIIFQGMLGSGKTTFLKRLEQANVSFFQVQNDGAGSFDAASFGDSNPPAGQITLFHRYKNPHAKEQEYQAFKEQTLDRFLPQATEQVKDTISAPVNPKVYPISGGCVCCGAGPVSELTQVFEKVQTAKQGFGEDTFVCEITGVGLGEEVLEAQSKVPLGRLVYTHLITMINADDCTWDEIPEDVIRDEHRRKAFFEHRPDLEVYFDQLKASKWIINIRQTRLSDKVTRRIAHIQRLIRLANPTIQIDEDKIKIMNVKTETPENISRFVTGNATIDPKKYSDTPDEGGGSEMDKLRLTSHSLKVGEFTQDQYGQLKAFLEHQRQQRSDAKEITRFKGVVVVNDGRTKRTIKLESNGSSDISETVLSTEPLSS